MDFADSQVALLAGAEDGQLSISTVVDFGVAAPGSVAIGDITGDGVPDVVAGGGNLHVAEGLGDGTFASPVLKPSPLVGDLSIADIDGDGADELVACGDETVLIYSRSNGGDIVADEPVVQLEVPGAPPSIVEIVVADVDVDGALDILVVRASAEVLLFRADP